MKLILIILFFSPIFVKAQDYQLTLSSGDTLCHISFENMIGDSVEIFHSWHYKWIKVNSIIEIIKIKESKSGKGAGIGLLCGALIGTMVTHSKTKDISDPYGLGGFVLPVGKGVGGLTGFVCGGLIGAVVSQDEVYDISKISYMEKLVIIESIISKESKD